MALNSAVARFMTMALDRQDYAEANRIFNTSFWGAAAILMLLFAPCLWFSFHPARFFNMPADREQDFVWLFLSALGVFFLSTLSNPFSITSYCRNRLDLSNAVSILNTVVRISIIVLLFSFSTPRVWHVGVALLAAAGASAIGAFAVSRHLTPMLELRLSWFSLAALRKMTGMGSWIVINTIGALLYLSIDLVLANRMFGSEATGRYGAVMIWSTFLRTFAGVVAGVFGPTIIMLYSRNDVAGLAVYSRQAMKFLGLVMAIPIGLICGLSKPLLLLWLGADYVGLAPLMSLMTFHLCVNLAVLPLLNIQVATNHVRVPGILTCVMGVLNLGLAVLLAGPAGWGLYGIAAAGAIMLTAKNLVFTPLHAARILRLPLFTFFGQMMPVIAFVLGLIVLGLASSAWLSIDTWPRLIAAGSLIGVASVAFVYIRILTKPERANIIQMLGSLKASAA
jgi:membrane protein EpsK